LCIFIDKEKYPVVRVSDNIPELIRARVTEPYPRSVYYKVICRRQESETSDSWALELEKLATESNSFGHRDIQLPFNLAGRDIEKESFRFEVDKIRQTIRIGAIDIREESCRGLGLGGFCVSTLISQLQPFYSDYEILKEPLSDYEGKGENGKRRDALYRNRGFQIKEDRSEVWADRLSQLTPEINREKVTEISLTELRISRVVLDLMAVAKLGHQVKVRSA
jgi:hypothetical protein